MSQHISEDIDKYFKNQAIRQQQALLDKPRGVTNDPVIHPKHDPINQPKHYDKAIEPIDYIMQNGLNFSEGSAIKYITRHREKNGAEDIRKAIKFCQFILKYEYGETLGE
jgi:hypothetical protein